MLPARPADCVVEVDALLEGYEQFRPFDHGSLRLVELLRGLALCALRRVIARRWEDPAFTRAFPHFGSDNYWEQQYADIEDQLRQLVF